MPLEHAPTLDHLARALNEDREREVRRHLRTAQARHATAARHHVDPTRWLVQALGRLRTAGLPAGQRRHGGRAGVDRRPAKDRATPAPLRGATDPASHPQAAPEHRSRTRRFDARRAACASCA
ncbi:MAG: hypothetical protein P8Y13_11940 [Deinococcales bacterium]